MSDRKSRNSGREGGGDGDVDLERLPGSIINEILIKLDVGTICSVACTSKTLCAAVAESLPSFSSLDLSTFSPDPQTLSQIIFKLKGVETVTLDCLRLDDSSVLSFLGANIEELNLLKCSSLSFNVLSAIGQRCPNLRVLVLELGGNESSEIFKRHLIELFKGCLYLEFICIKVRGAESYADGFQSIEVFLPKMVKVLKLQPILVHDATSIIRNLTYDWNSLETASSFSIMFCPRSLDFKLRHLSLLLDVITDELIILIVTCLPHLVELDVEDRPGKEPIMPHDLTNNGLQSLSSCQHITSLTLVRSRQNYSGSFKRVNDLGMFLLSEGCPGLESVRLGGFSTVTDAGFSAILNSCQLKKFEVRNALLLSDLAFQDVTGSLCSLAELRLLSCNLLTSEVVEKLASSNILEVLDLCGCRSIADACLNYISCLCTLTTLNLSGADVTDEGIALIGRGNSPIVCLCLRGCKRVTDRGIDLLLHSGGTIRNTLSSLDLSSIPGISDRAIITVASVARVLTELCIRYCFYVTDASLEILASEREFGEGSKALHQLDLFHCIGLSVGSVEMLKKPFFRGLRWLGVGLTRLANRRNAFSEIHKQRPWLTVCFDGCEMGCHDGWQFHNLDHC